MPGIFNKPKNVKGPDPSQVLWCPFCDWHMDDNHTNRKRLGQHIGGCHNPEVAFPRGVEPDMTG